ncbi:hypothetical protein [Nocardia sp. NPDC057455]|uniref:hypothetical protein n=1 Tax=Nocardia sp. NPDC057455 TaxID=3346138 RepID=UPI00366D9B10
MTPDDRDEKPDKQDESARRRRLSFAGLMQAEPDLAARSEDILYEERQQRG